jgi:hypothetical protein
MYFALLVLSLTHHAAASSVAKCGCPSNEEVDCSYASITYLPGLVGNLKTLNASHNRITILKSSFIPQAGETRAGSCYFKSSENY